MQEVINRLKSAKTVVYDSETSGLDWKRQHIVGHVVTFSPNPADSFYLPVRHGGGGNIGGHKGPQTATGWDGKLHPIEKDLIAALDRPGLLVVGHSLAFDLKFLHRVGFAMRPSFEDTIINEPMLDEFVGRYSLESCAHRHKVQHKKSAEIAAHLRSKFPEIKPDDKGAMGHYWRLAGDDPVGVDYARGDGTSTWQLRDKQMVMIRDQELTLAHSVESRLIPVLARMMIRGVKVDPARLDWMIGHINKTLKKLNAAFPKDFNPLSPKDVQAWLEQHGCTDWPYTAPSRTFPNGKPSFAKDWLEEQDAGKPIIRLRKLGNLLASFALPLQERHMFKGRVHTSFNQLRSDDFGTVTARLSSSDPNMQQVPKHDEELGRLFRSAFVPDYGLWGDVDYSQIEPRLMAYYTRAKVFLDDFRNNPKADSHTAVSKAALATQGRDWDKLDKAEQKYHRNNFGKRINQTVITGGGRGVLISKYKVPGSEVDKMLADYHRTLPELKPFQKRAAARYRQRGYVLSLLGRRARLDDPDRDYTALNRLLQVGNADLIKLKMVEVDEYLEAERVGGKRPNVDMLLNCHDALSFQFDEAARPVYDRCRDIMQDFSSEAAVIKLDLPIVTDAGEGATWAIATYGEEE